MNKKLSVDKILDAAEARNAAEQRFEYDCCCEFIEEHAGAAAKEKFKELFSPDYAVEEFYTAWLFEDDNDAIRNSLPKLSRGTRDTALLLFAEMVKHGDI